MTVSELMSGDLDGAALGKQEDSRVSSGKAHLGGKSTKDRCAPRDPGKAGPVALLPACPLTAGEVAPKSILDPAFRYTASFDTDLRRTFARVRLDRRRAADKQANAAIQGSSNVSPIVRTSMPVRPYV